MDNGEEHLLLDCEFVTDLEGNGHWKLREDCIEYKGYRGGWYAKEDCYYLNNTYYPKFLVTKIGDSYFLTLNAEGHTRLIFSKMELEEALHLLEDTLEFNKYIDDDNVHNIVKLNYARKTGRNIISDICTYTIYKMHIKHQRVSLITLILHLIKLIAITLTI